MNNDVDLVPMCTRHIDALAEIEKVCFSTPWSHQLIENELSNPMAVYVVAEEEGNPIGYAGMINVLGSGEIMSVAVLPEYRGRGIATKLLNALISHARDSEIEEMYLEVRSSNENAKKLYEKFGFKETGLRQNYYENPREDAVLMTKIL
ncbi:MAG: ribosomal protein S18-alanine N-acetyltransferase [Bacillota bacterium]|nr:ribosomal protein S18-alanine N-acetyltransferase [Bacillota bacterium]